MKFRYIFLLFLFLPPLFAEEAPTTSIASIPIEVPTTPSLNAPNANWMFSGMVSAENGEQYYFYFELEKNDGHLHAIASLIDATTKRVVLHEDVKAPYENSANNARWRAGRAFLSFNSITNTWIFGIKKNQDNTGFHFKADMLNLATIPPSRSQTLRQGIEFLLSPTSLNGHLQTGSKEYFVTSTKTWFRQIWSTKPHNEMHQMSGILCVFNNGNTFYSLHLKEEDALRGSLAGWKNESGDPMPVSQFVKLDKEKDNRWMIDINSPNVHLSLENSIPEASNNYFIVGSTSGLPGFCGINQEITIEKTES